MASGPANAPPDLEWKRGAVEAFRIVSRTLAPQQAEWLQSQAQIDEKQAQIKVVEAMRSEGVFLETEGINPEIPAADQEVRIEKLLDKLETTKVVLQHLRDVLDRHPRAWDSERSKTRVLAITGVKGCGKTRLRKHLAGYAEDRPGEKEKENRNHGFMQHLAQKKQPGPSDGPHRLLCLAQREGDRVPRPILQA